ncbi:MAG: methionyl-tRNA formyltransferase [Chloroflexi bacterium]|nr:methionyl-tRNA formyltransferase [Chloroflexota bacterium]
MEDNPIVFMGSPFFAVPVLKALVQDFAVAGVVTQPDKPAGRGRELRPCPVKEAALELNLPVIQPERLRGNSSAFEQIKAWKPAVIVVAAYGKILRKDILDLPRFGCLNVHASLLPRWRGASPIQAAILHGDTQTGITIMKMEEGLDSGPLLSRFALDLSSTDTAETLEMRLAGAGAALLTETLPDYLKGIIEPVPQPSEGQTYAPLLKKEDGLLDFSQPVELLERQIRAYYPWPGCYIPLDNGILKIHKAYIEHDIHAVAGRKSIIDQRPAIGAKGGSLVFSQVQPAGKKPMEGKAFLMGYHKWLGGTL